MIRSFKRWRQTKEAEKRERDHAAGYDTFSFTTRRIAIDMTNTAVIDARTADDYASTKSIAKSFLHTAMLASNLVVLRSQRNTATTVLAILSISINLASAIACIILYYANPDTAVDPENIDIVSNGLSSSQSSTRVQYSIWARTLNIIVAVTSMLLLVINGAIAVFW